MASTPQTQQNISTISEQAETTQPNKPIPAGMRGLWAFRDYRLLWGGTAMTQTGMWMQQVAQGWLVFQLTDSPLALGLIGFVRGFPNLLLSLPGGVLVDRFDKRGLLLLFQTIAVVLALAMALMVGSGQIQ